MQTATPPRSGYTLPVFACAAAIAALQHLLEPPTSSRPAQSVSVDLIRPDQRVEIPIEQIARLDQTSALAIARSDPGDNLDLTRHTPVWAWVQWADDTQDPPIRIEGGEGIGRYQVSHEQGSDSVSATSSGTPPLNASSSSQSAIYRYATELLHTNLQQLLPQDRAIKVTIILPEGRALATRTSNAAFGVVEGLSLLGTSGIAQPLSAPNQLDLFRSALTTRLHESPDAKACLVYCIGENGLDLARRFGIADVRILKTANWLGPLLVEGANQGVESIVLLGYHGKLIKLAGGIFHTHHHLADARLDIFIAQCSVLGLAPHHLQTLWNCPTTEAALQTLKNLDQSTGSHWVETVYSAIAQRIDQRTQAYIYTHSERQVKVGTVLFGRDRQIICQSAMGKQLGQKLGANFYVTDT